MYSCPEELIDVYFKNNSNMIKIVPLLFVPSKIPKMTICGVNVVYIRF